jgi:hypothetical protein
MPRRNGVHGLPSMTQIDLPSMSISETAGMRIVLFIAMHRDVERHQVVHQVHGTGQRKCLITEDESVAEISFSPLGPTTTDLQSFFGYAEAFK